MVKKISALLIALFGSVMLLFGCSDPYKNFNLSVSKTDVVLYLSEEEGLQNSETLQAKITGAGKGISTEVGFSQYGTNGVNDIVYIEDISHSGNSTNFTLKAKNSGKGVIYVNSVEGNKRVEINVTVYVPIKKLDFTTSTKAVKFGGEVDLNKFLTFTPFETNQTDADFYIDENVNEKIVVSADGKVTETTYAKIENGILISKNSSAYAIDDSGMQYVNVYAVSKFNSEIVTAVAKIYVVNVVDSSEVLLTTNSDVNSQQIPLLPTATNLFDIILGKNSTIPFVFSRNLQIKIGSDFVTDKQYSISTSLDNKTSDVISLSSLVSENSRQNYTGTAEFYPYKTYQINQQVKNIENNVETFEIYIDRVGFEGLFTLTFTIRTTVKEFGEQINVLDELGNNLNNSYASIYNVYGGGAIGTPLQISVNPYSSTYKVFASVKNAPDVNGKKGFEIYLRNNILVTNTTELTSGTMLYVKHNYSFSDLQQISTNPEQENCPRLVLTYSYSLAPTSVTTGYKTYNVTTEIPLVALAGITDVGFVTTSPIKINAVTGKAIGTPEPEEGEEYEIVVGTIGEQKVDLPSLIASVTALTVNGEQPKDFNVFNNEFFSMEYREQPGGNSATTLFNRIVLTPILQPRECNVEFLIRTKNNITKRIRVEIFVPIIYEFIDANASHEAIHLEILENDESKNSVYDLSDKTEYFLGLDFNNYIINTPIENVEDVTAFTNSVTYFTQNAVTMAVNSAVGFNIYNYAIVQEENVSSIRAINYNHNVTVSVNRSYYNVETRTINGIKVPFIVAGNIKTEAPIDVRFTISGYDNFGNVINMTKTIKLTIIKPITSIQLNPVEVTVYEKNSVGYFKSALSEAELNLSLYPANAISADEATKPTIKFTLLNAKDVVYTYSGVDVDQVPYSVSFLVEDFIELVTDVDNYKCYVKAATSSSYLEKIEICKGYDFSFKEETIISNVYKRQQDLIAVVSASLQQYNKPLITSNVNVRIKYAEKINNIITSIDENGIYFDSRDYTISNGEIIGDGKEVSFVVEPTNAYNKTLVAYIEDESVAKIVSGIDENNRIISNTIVVKPYVNAGRTSLIIAAEDSYVKNGDVIEALTKTDISIRVANGTKAYPFEIANAEQFLEIGRDINLGNNSYYYVLSDTINLNSIESLGGVLPPFKEFNGGLSGLFTYISGGIYYSRQNYIHDFSLNKTVNAVENENYTFGLFESLGETAEIENLIFEGVKFDFEITNASHNGKTNIGVIAGTNYGQILNSRVSGVINVNSETKNVNVGGMVGESFTYNHMEYSYTITSGESSFVNTTTGKISYLPQSSTATSSSKVNSEVVINYTGRSANNNLNGVVNLGGVAGSVYTYSKLDVTENGIGTTKTVSLASGYDFKNENLSNFEIGLSAYQREMGSAYSDLNVVATINGLDENNNRVKANVGGAFGYTNSTFFSNIVVAPNLQSKTNVGGLVGHSEHSLFDGIIVEFANAGQRGINTLSLISEGNVGGLIGFGKNINIYYSYVRSYFNNSGINNNSYYGNIALFDSGYAAGGLVGYLESSKISNQLKNNGYNLTGDIIVNLTVEHLLSDAESSDYDEALYNKTYANGIFNSYFSADINLSVPNHVANNNCYVGGLIGISVPHETGANDTNIVKNSYVTGNIKGLDPLEFSVNSKTENINTPIGKTVEYKIGVVSYENGEYKFTENTDNENSRLVKIETDVTGNVITEGSKNYLEIITTYTVYNYYHHIGAIIGTELDKLTVETKDVTPTDTGAAENETITVTQKIFKHEKKFGSSYVGYINVENVYVANNLFKGVSFADNLMLVNTFKLTVTNSSTSTESTTDNTVTTVEQIIQPDLTDNNSFTLSSDVKFNMIKVTVNKEDYIPYTWLHYVGSIYSLNNGYPVLFKYSHINGEILFKVLPTNINTNILNINQTFSNLSYIKKDSSHVVVFYNNYLSGKNFKNVNKYKLLLGDENLSTNYVNMAQIVLDLPNLESVGITAEYENDIVISSSDPNIVEVLNDLVLLTKGEGEVTLRVASKLDVSIFDEITILVVKGVSDYNLYQSRNIVADANKLLNGVTYTQFIDNVSNYFAAASNRDIETTINIGVENFEGTLASGYNGVYEVNENIGVMLKVNSNNTGTAEVNGVILENGKTYLFNFLSDFSFIGKTEGSVSYELTPFIKVTANNFGETLTASNGDVINNCVLIEALRKNYVFNVKPKAESLEIDKTNANLDPSKYVDLNVSVVTSNFNLVGEDVIVNEDIISLITDTTNNQTVGSISLLNATSGRNNSLIDVEILGLKTEKIVTDGVVNKVKATFSIRLSFNIDKFKDRTGGVTYNINNIAYSFSFTPETNNELNKVFNIKIVPKNVNDIKMKFYANSEVSGSGDNAEFNPQEVETNFIVPSRMGLLKIELFPEFNDAESVELTVSDAYKNYVAFTQKLAVMRDGETGYAINYQSVDGYPNYLPGFNGITLVNQSILANNSVIYNGNYYVQISLDENTPVNSNIVFTTKAYKTVNGVKTEIYSKDITLTVQPLPTVNLTVNGSHNALLNVGGQVELTVEATNFEGDIDISVSSGVNNTQVVLDYNADLDKYYVIAKLDAIAGDNVAVTARASRYINGIKETRNSTVNLQVVEYIINNIRQSGAVLSGNNTYSFEMLNGTNQMLDMTVDATYNANNEGVTTRIKTFAQEAAGRLRVAGSNQYANNWYLRTAPGSYERLNAYGTYDGFGFIDKTLNDLNATHSYEINARKVGSNTVLGLKVQYFYNEFGLPTLNTNNAIGYTIYENEFDFTLVVKDNSTYDHPNPIATEEEFLALQNETAGHYILVNDIVLNNYEPFSAAFASLDGNGHYITINNFNTSSYSGSSNVNVGLFETISANTVIKNVTIDICNLLITQSQVNEFVNGGTTDANGNILRTAKIDLTNISAFNFGVLAGTNNGSVTNIKIVNSAPTNVLDASAKNLFIYSTLNYLNGSLVDAKIGGLVGVNNGTISNSYVGLNATYYTNGRNSEELHSNTEASSVREQTYPFFIVGGKGIAGFVNENSGIIANSYNLGVGIINSPVIAQGAKTAGFVVSNQSNGYIFNCMAEGIETLNYRVSEAVHIEAKGNIGGFVYENSGRIENAFSNVSITTNSDGSGGFVYDNQATGTIRYAYSTSPNAFNSKSHGQFTGIDSRNKYNNAGTLTSCYYLILDNELANEDEPAQAIRGTLVNSDSAKEGEDVGQNKDNPFRYTGSFNGFSFAAGNETNNVWKISTNENYGPQLVNLISYNTFSHRVLTNTTQNDNTTIYDYEYDSNCKYGATGVNNQIINPLLVNTASDFVTFIINNSKTIDIAGDKHYLFGDKENSGVYYIRLINDLDFSQITLNTTKVDNKLISDITFAGVLDGNGMNMTGIRLVELKQGTINENFGLFRQIGLSDDQLAAAKIDNSMMVEGDSSEDTQLAKRIGPSIQNVNITINGFEATQSIKVGALAGSIYDTSLINVTLNGGDNVAINGRNLVGGFAGLIINKPGTIINNVTTNNISVTASRRSNTSLSEVSRVNGYGVAYNGSGNLIKFESYHNTVIKKLQDENYKISLDDLQKYSYAGSIAGVIDAGNRSEENAYYNTIRSLENNNGTIKKHRTEPTENIISNITVQGGGVVAAEQAGGLFGYVSQNTHIRNSKYLVGFEPNSDSGEVKALRQYISGYNYSGGIVGENYGMLEQVSVEHVAGLQEKIDADYINSVDSSLKVRNLFIGTNSSENNEGETSTGVNYNFGVAVGGIAGFSDHGIILDSYVKVDVENPKTKIAGGIVGVAARTNFISHAYVTGNVLANNVIGGAIGVYNKTGAVIYTTSEQTVLLNDIKNAKDENSSLTTNSYRLTLDYVVAANLWNKQVEDKVYDNIKNIYATASGSYYKFALRMPEIGNQKFYKYNSPSQTTPDPGVDNTEIRYTSYIGSLVGIMHYTNVRADEGNAAVNLLSNDQVYTSSSTNMAINKGREIATVNTGYGQNYTFSSVISTTLNSAKLAKNSFNVGANDGVQSAFGSATVAQFLNESFNELPTKQMPTSDNSDIIGDVLEYAVNIGHQFHLNAIFGKAGKNANMFNSFAWDTISMRNISPDSGSQVWMVDGDKVLPEYIVGIYSNFNELKNTNDVNTQIRIVPSTKNQFYLLTTSETAVYDFSAIDNYNGANLFFNTFEGTLIGNNNPEISIKGEKTKNVFNKINSATIMGVNFRIIVPENYISTILEKDSNIKSFGLLANQVTGSVISNVNVDIEFRGSNVEFLNSFDNIGLLFGSVEDSTLSNITVNITYVNDPTIKTATRTIGATTPTATKNLNFGLVMGNGLRAIVSDVKINATNGRKVILDASNKTTVNYGTIAGQLKDCSLSFVNNNYSYVDTNNGEIKLIKAQNTNKVIASVGGIVGNINGTTLSNVCFGGNVFVGDQTGNTVNCELNVGGIVGNANASVLTAVLANTFNNGSVVSTSLIRNQILVYNGTTTYNTFVGGIAGNLLNSNIGNKLATSSATVSSSGVTNANQTILNVNVANGNVYVGGVAGYVRNAHVTNGIFQAYNNGEINVTNNGGSSNLNIGGIVGEAVGGVFENIFNLGKITFTNSNNYAVGGLFGRTTITSSNSEDGLQVLNFISYGDIYSNGKSPDRNRYLGGVVGCITGANISFAKGYTLTRVYNAKNSNSVYATNDYINGIGYVQNVNDDMFNKVYYVHEFFPYTNVKKLTSNSNEVIGKVLLESNSDTAKFGGISYGNLNWLDALLGDENSFYSISGDVANNLSLKVPRLYNTLNPYTNTEKIINTLFTSGQKLNPIRAATNQSVADNNYYLLTKDPDVEKTFNLQNVPQNFHGLIVGASRNDVSKVVGLNTKNNYGILANFKVEATSSYNFSGVLVNVNSGTIANVVTYGYLPVTSTLSNTGKQVSLFVNTNNANIVGSGSSVMLVSSNESYINATKFSAFVGTNSSTNTDNTNCGKAYIKDCYSVGSYIINSNGSQDLTNKQLTAQVAGLIHTNSGIIETSYYAGTLNAANGNFGTSAIVHTSNSGTVTNCYYDINATSYDTGATKFETSKTSISNDTRFVLTEYFINAKTIEIGEGDGRSTKNFYEFSLSTSGIPSAFDTFSTTYNYGYPTIKGGIKINTLQRYNNENVFILFHKGQINNLSNLTGYSYLMVSNIDMANVNKGETNVNYINSQTDLKHNLYGNNFNLLNLKVGDGANFTTGNQVGLFGKIDGKTVNNLTFNNAQIIANIGSTTVDTATRGVGVLAGYVVGSTISNVKLTNCVVTANDYDNVGGLIGKTSERATTIRFDNANSTNVSATVTSANGSVIGGVVGYLSNSSTITNAKFGGSVSGKTKVGGVVGHIVSGTVTGSAVSDNARITATTINNFADNNSGSFRSSIYSTISGMASSSSYLSNGSAGGIAGEMEGGTITNCAVGGGVAIKANSTAGGVVGKMIGSSSITNSYAITINNISVSGSDAGKGDYALGGIVGYMTNSSINGSGLTLRNSTIGNSSSNVNFVIGGIVGYQDASANVSSVISSSNKIYGSRLVGGITGFHYSGQLNNSSTISNTLYYKSNYDIDEYNGFDKSVKPGPETNYSSMIETIKQNNYNDNAGCVTINSTTTVNDYFAGTNTWNRLDEFREYYAIEYGGIDLRSSNIKYNNNNNYNYLDIRLYFGFITGGYHTATQQNVSASGNVINGIYDDSTLFAVHRDDDDFDGHNEWYWYLKKRQIRRNFNATNNNMNSLRNGTVTYNKFVGYGSEYNITIGRDTYNITDLEYQAYSYNRGDYNPLIYIAAGYSCAYKEGADPITYIQNNLANVYNSYVNDYYGGYYSDIKRLGTSLLRNLYGKHAYPGMSLQSFENGDNYKSKHYYWNNHKLGGDMVPNDLNRDGDGWGAHFNSATTKE